MFVLKKRTSVLIHGCSLPWTMHTEKQCTHDIIAASDLPRRHSSWTRRCHCVLAMAILGKCCCCPGQMLFLTIYDFILWLRRFGC